MSEDRRAGALARERRGPDPKPAKRLIATIAQWRQLRLLKLGPCRGCPDATLSEYAVTLHHLVPRSLGGDDVAGNLIPLCGDGTLGCHGIVEDGRGREDFAAVSARIRARETDEEREYVIRKKGREWLEIYYPKGPDNGASRSS